MSKVGDIVKLFPENASEAVPFQSEWVTTFKELVDNQTPLKVGAIWRTNASDPLSQLNSVSWYDPLTNTTMGANVRDVWCIPHTMPSPGPFTVPGLWPIDMNELRPKGQEITSECECNLWAGCTCGQMKREMKAKGKFKNSVTGLWDDEQA